ncbi:MAG TPA: flavin reductase family protein [Beijerinckiaceae bacterium]
MSLPPSLPSLGADRFREGMSRVAGAVHVITTDGESGRAGFTATAVAPVTDSPATLLICANATGRAARAAVRNKVLCVNTIGAGDRSLADIFAGRAGVDGPARFEAGDWDLLVTGAPALRSALVSFDCRIVEARLVSTHEIIIAEVEAVRLGPADRALLYLGRDYTAL